MALNHPKGITLLKHVSSNMYRGWRRFGRAASRLHEMQTEHYYLQHHARAARATVTGTTHAYDPGSGSSGRSGDDGGGCDTGGSGADNAAYHTFDIGGLDPKLSKR